MTPKHGVWSSNLPGRATLFDLYIQQIAVEALFPLAFGTNRRLPLLARLQVLLPTCVGDGPKLCLMEEWKDAKIRCEARSLLWQRFWRSAPAASAQIREPGVQQNAPKLV